MLLAGCAQVNEEVSSQDEAVYISPSAPVEKVNYPLSLLNDSEKQMYSRLIEAVNAYEENILLEGADEDTAKKLFKLMYTQENRIFWVDSRFHFNPESEVLNIFYRYDAAQSAEMRAVLDLEAAKILAAVPEGSTDYEKVKILHDSIILGCSFSKAGEHVNNAYGVIVDGKAQCEGYAFAMSYLCSAAGLENYVITGTSAEGESHAWNKVLADGQWYNVDCTWDDPILKRESKGYIRHDYMFLCDAEINNISHFPDLSLFEPVPCTATENNYFLKEGLMCSDVLTAEKLIEEQIKKAASEKKSDVEIRLDNKAAYTELVSVLFDNGVLKAIIEKLNGNSGAQIASAIKSVNDELLTVHISLIYEGEE